MNDNLNPDGENLNTTDKDIERALRPIAFEDFSGQESVIDNLRVFVAAAKQRNEALDHVLLHGPPGLGKTTLATFWGNFWKHLGYFSFRHLVTLVANRK